MIFPTIGLSCVALILSVFALVLQHLSFWETAVWMGVAGLFMGSTLGVVQVALLLETPADMIGRATAFLQLSRMIGASLSGGFGGLIFAQSRHLLADISDPLSAGILPTRAFAVLLRAEPPGRLPPPPADPVRPPRHRWFDAYRPSTAPSKSRHLAASFKMFAYNIFIVWFRYRCGWRRAGRRQEIVMSRDGGEERGGMPLRLEETKIYPAAVHGTFRRLKWALLAVSLAVYYLLPLLRWDRGPGRPDQAVLFDFSAQRFYVFGIEIWPQEVYYITGLMILAAFALFLATALVGRAWCGYLCPQTLWTDLFRVVERFFQGERREQMRRDEGPWTFDRLWRKAATHVSWLVIGVGTGGAFVLYFTDAPTLLASLFTPEAPALAWIWIGILTATTYLLAGFSREQVCLYMCPWPRIQAALTDEWALNVSYRWDRGEPRGSLKATEKARAAGQPAGDCVDCGRCVAVCPTGVDIRHGLQMGCIQCGLCIDACDEVMIRIGREPRLIAYDSDINIERRGRGEAPVHRMVRPRTVIYAVLIIVVGAVLAWTFATRPTEMVSVLHDRNPIAVANSDGSIRNAYTLRLSNMAPQERVFEVSATPMPAGARLEADGTVRGPDGALTVAVGPDRTREIRVRLTVPADGTTDPRRPLVFTVRSAGSRDLAVEDFFARP